MNKSLPIPVIPHVSLKVSSVSAPIRATITETHLKLALFLFAILSAWLVVRLCRQTGLKNGPGSRSLSQSQLRFAWCFFLHVTHNKHVVYTVFGNPHSFMYIKGESVVKPRCRCPRYCPPPQISSCFFFCFPLNTVYHLERERERKRELVWHPEGFTDIMGLSLHCHSSCTLNKSCW